LVNSISLPFFPADQLKSARVVELMRIYQKPQGGARGFFSFHGTGGPSQLRDED
jgi:hypothetical protein